jgi:hypothetical protein
MRREAAVKSVRLGAGFLLLSTLPLAAGDIGGIWIGQIPGRNNTFQDVAFQFNQNGAKLEGKLYGDFGSTRIVEGTVSAGGVSFVVVAREQAGNQINESRLRFTGCFQNGELELTRERESSTNAGNSGGVQMRNNAAQTFRLKRLL